MLNHASMHTIVLCSADELIARVAAMRSKENKFHEGKGMGGIYHVDGALGNGSPRLHAPSCALRCFRCACVGQVMNCRPFR